MKRKINDLKESDRDVDTWFSEFDAEMSDYNNLLWEGGSVNGTVNETNMCDTPEVLKNKLLTIREKIDLVM